MKKAKLGLHDNWVERMHIQVDTEDDDGIKPIVVGNKGYSCSGSSAVSVSGSSQPMTQPNSSDNDEGGITDDAREREEPGDLSGKAMHPNTRKHYYYGGSSNVAETGVSSVVNVEFDAHILHRSGLWPALSPPLQFPPS